jgi:hypothetical protein
MNNEPVAWMDDLSFFTKKPEDMEGVVALYAHPVKELTDDEILEIGRDCAKNPDINFQITFARAILIKAQKK